MNIKKILLNIILLAMATMVQAVDKIEMCSLMGQEAGRPLIALSGTVHRFPLIALGDLPQEIGALPEDSAKVMGVFLAYHSALKAGDLVKALSMVASGVSRDKVKGKYDSATAEEIEQRKSIDIKVVGMGAAYGRAVVWYEMQGESLPGKRFPWLDQLIKGADGWSLAFDVPINNTSVQFLSALSEADATGKLQPLEAEDYLFFSPSHEGENVVRITDVAERKMAGDPILAVSKSIINQRQFEIKSMVAEGATAPAVHALKDAFSKIRAGESFAKFTVGQGAVKVAEDPFFWRNADSGYSYCWAISPVEEGFYVVIGTADEARVSFIVDKELKISQKPQDNAKKSIFNLLVRSGVVPAAIGQGRKSVD